MILPVQGSKKTPNLLQHFQMHALQFVALSFLFLFSGIIIACGSSSGGAGTPAGGGGGGGSSSGGGGSSAPAGTSTPKSIRAPPRLVLQHLLLLCQLALYRPA